MGGHLLSSNQLCREGLSRILSLAEVLEPVARGDKVSRVLAGAQLANLFFEPSTRSRISFGAAFGRLGGHVHDTTGIGMTSLAKGESLEDTARVVSGYVDAVVLRHPQNDAALVFASASRVPVINGGDGDGEHPTQSLTDLFTLQKELSRQGKMVDGARIAIIGDLRFGRTVHSLIITLAEFQAITLVLLSPLQLAMPQRYIDYPLGRGHRVVIAKTLTEALEGVDAIYLTRYQTERFKNDAGIPAAAADMRINAEIVARYAPKGTIIMHPLPRSSTVGELATDLDTSPDLAIFRQTDNGVPIRMAVFCAVFGIGADLIAASLDEPNWPLRKREAPDVPT